MSGTYVLYSRLLFVFALVCAAVIPFTLCSDAARASSITTQVDNGVRHTVLRRPYTPHRQHQPFSTGLPSLQTGANSETEKSGNYRKALSTIHHHLNPLRLTKGSFSSNNNSPDNRPSRAGTTSVQSGTSPASGYRLLSYNSHPVIIKKSSYKEAASPFHPSEVRNAKEAQKTSIKERVPRNDFASLFLSQTGRYRSTSLPTSRGLYSGYKETKELMSAGTRSKSSGIQSSKSFGPASQTAPHARSISSSSDASVIKSVPSREKLTPSITDFSLGLHSVSGSETPLHKNTRSYWFKDSQTAFGGRETVQTVTDEAPSALPMTSHKRRASEFISGFSSNGKPFQQSQRKDPTKELQQRSDDANPLHHNANVTYYGAWRDGFTKYQPAAQIYAPWTDAFVGRFVPVPHADVPGNSAAGSITSVVRSFSNATTRRSTHASTPGHVQDYVFRGFDDPKWRAMKEVPILSASGSNKRTNSRGYSFDKGKGFKSTNMNPPLSPKYSFGQRSASATVAKPEGALEDDASPSPGTRQDFTSGFKEARPGLPPSDAGVDSDSHHGQFRTNKRIDGLKVVGTQSLEGDTTLVGEPDESARVQRGFELPSSQMWEPNSSHVNPMSPTEPSSEDHTPLIRPSLAYFRSPAILDIETRPKSESKLPATKAHLHTSSTVRGKRVRGGAKKLNESTAFNYTGYEAIIWRPARFRAVNYADIASASLSDVTATTQAPITPADKDDFPTTSAAPKQKEGAVYGAVNSEEAVRSGDDADRGPEGAGQNKLAVGGKDVDNDMKTSDLFLDDEGSVSGDFDAPDVFTTAPTESESRELEYLRISPGNFSFKSMNLSRTET
ncbi:uncharacterized protein LOC117748141 [Cyclopterus lumpus]|uniref:uncharacterized protein LOC117748141 n=1 Tax=Cyclopterus lumpus TaxID=8103 RepID=UPI001486C1FD|nr:uncharacterized protein LOC117748141 [Cyclopterus lumpus]